MANERVSALSTQIYKPDVTDFKDLDSNLLGSRKISPFDEHGNFRNALALRGAAYFDGTSGTRITSTLTGQSIGTDPFSLVCIFKVPTSNPGNNAIVGCGPSATDYSNINNVRLEILTDGRLNASIAQSAYRDFSVTNNLVTNWGGKIVCVVVVCDRTTTDPKVYINGVLQAGTGGGADSWATASITSTYFGVGMRASSQIFTGEVYSASLYDLALTAADVIEIFELGGGVPYRYQFGSQAQLITSVSRNSDFSALATDWVSSGGSMTVSAATGQLVCTMVSSGFQNVSLPSNKFTTPTLGKAYRLDFDIISNTDAAGSLTGFFNIANSYFFQNFSGAAGHVSGVAIFTSAGASACIQYNSNTGTLTLDNMALKRVGAVVHLPLDDGQGLVARDVSTNALHGVLTATGIAWTRATGQGTTTNDSAAAGNIGEYISSTVATGGTEVALTNNTAANVTSISLTPGDWDVEGYVGFHQGATTVGSNYYAGISATSATLAGDTQQNYLPSVTTSGATFGKFNTPKVRLSLSVTTTIYLVAQSAFTTSTMAAFGQIRARRVR